MDRVFLLLSLLLIFQSCTDDPPDPINEAYACHWAKIDLTSQRFAGEFFPCWDTLGFDGGKEASMKVEIEGDSAVFTMTDIQAGTDTTFKLEVICNYAPLEPTAKASLQFLPSETIFNYSSTYRPEYGTLDVWFRDKNCVEARFRGSK